LNFSRPSGTTPGASDDRRGYGPRLPLLLISPFTKTNFVDHQVTDQSSILRFIEDNWNLRRIGGQPKRCPPSRRLDQSFAHAGP
jgi:phospholipase C